MAQVHRFYDCVAVFLDGGKTVYVKPENAATLAKALTDCAKDIEANPFIDSAFTTTTLEFDDVGYNGTNYIYDENR